MEKRFTTVVVLVTNLLEFLRLNVKMASGQHISSLANVRYSLVTSCSGWVECIVIFTRDDVVHKCFNPCCNKRSRWCYIALCKSMAQIFWTCSLDYLLFLPSYSCVMWCSFFPNEWSHPKTERDDLQIRLCVPLQKGSRVHHEGVCRAKMSC